MIFDNAQLERIADVGHDARKPPSGWDIVVVTRNDPERNYANLRNALLYGDRVYWLPAHLWASFFVDFARRLAALPVDASSSDVLAAANQSQQVTLALLSEESKWWAGADSSFEDVLEPIGIGDLTSALGNAAIFPRWNSWAGRPQEGETFSTIAAALSSGIAQVLQDATSRFRMSYRFVISDWPPSGVVPQRWSSSSVALDLTSALSRVLLPDVSSLPMDVLAEMRERCAGSLDPMRAELLRLTEYLRELVGESVDPTVLHIEAENVISTRVEPVVLEASQRLQDLTKSKWRKLAVCVPKALGATAAGVFDPSGLSWAIVGKVAQSIGEATYDALRPEPPADPSAPSDTAAFVLKARNFLAEI